MVAEPLHDVLSQAGTYLSELKPDSKRIEVLNDKLRGLKSANKTSGEARERRLAWLAGLGTTSRDMQDGWHQAVKSVSVLDEQHRRIWLEPSETPLVVTGSCHAALMFGSLSPDVTAPDVQELARAAVDLYAPQGKSGNMCTVYHDAPVPESESHPWNQGYDLAEEVHEHVDGNFGKGGFVDVEALIKAHGVHIGKLTLSDTRVRGVAIAGPELRPGIFANERHASNTHPSGHRFTLAHELCHVLFDQEQGRALAVASGPWAPQAIEQRANAFAAMLLMPTSLLKQTLEELTAAVATPEGVNEVAKRLRVGRVAVMYHLVNLGFMHEEDRQQLEDDLLPLA